jgi:hypothetical protein
MHRHKHFTAIVLMCVPGILGGCIGVPQENAAASVVDVQVTILDPSVYPYGGAYRPVNVAEFQVKFFPAGHTNDATEEIFGNDLTHNETFVCDGSPLSADHSGRYTFWGTTRQSATPGVYSCVYTRDGVVTTLDIPAMKRPTLQSPAANTTVDRRTDLPLGFIPGQPGPAEVAINHMQVLTVGTGVTHAVIPSATLAQIPAGPGLVIVSQTVPLAPPGSGFHSVTVNEVVSSYVPVSFN